MNINGFRSFGSSCSEPWCQSEFERFTKLEQSQGGPVVEDRMSNDILYS